MRILVLGGTKFVGRSYVEEALAAGHELTLFNRGRTGPELFGDVEQIRGDRDVSLDQLSGRSWDVVFDPSCYLPRHARMSAAALADSAEHYTIVSSLSVYADESTPDQDESAPLAELTDPTSEDIAQHYGALKVAAEREIQRVFEDRTLVLRPGFIGGPYDQVDRMPWWLRRLAHGGEVLVPGQPNDLVQVIDARDIAVFALELSERREGGVFNLCAPPQGLEMRELLDRCAAGGGRERRGVHARTRGVPARAPAHRRRAGAVLGGDAVPGASPFRPVEGGRGRPEEPVTRGDPPRLLGVGSRARAGTALRGTRARARGRPAGGLACEGGVVTMTELADLRIVLGPAAEAIEHAGRRPRRALTFGGNFRSP